VLCLERPGRDVEHVVQHAHGDLDHLAEAVVIERAFSEKARLTKRVRLIEPRQQQP